MSISLAMIVKNEASRLRHCLGSVRDLADELIVVDTGSSDGTPDLARELGAQVHAFPWNGSFADARNESLRHCTQPWILVLDADEAVDALDHDRLRAAVQGAPTAYELRLRNYCEDGNYAIRDEVAVANHAPYTEGREHPYYVDAWGLRLFPNLPGLAFTGEIHELLHPFFRAQGIAIRPLEAVIHHYGKLNRALEAEKAKAYFALCLQALEANPNDPQALYNVVQQALQAQAWEVAVTHAERFRAQQSGESPLILYAGGFALLQLQRPAEALPWFERLLRQLPKHTLGLLHQASCLTALGRVEDARRSLKDAITLQPTLSQAYLNLAELEHRCGQTDIAQAILQLGFQTCAKDRLFLHGAVLFDLWTQDLTAAMTHAVQALEVYPEGGEGVWHQLKALRLHSQGQVAQALAAVERGLAVRPGDADLLRLRDKLAAGSPSPRS